MAQFPKGGLVVDPHLSRTSWGKRAIYSEITVLTQDFTKTAQQF